MKYYLFVLGTVIFTVIAQILVKIAMSGRGPLPGNPRDAILYTISAALDWHVIIALLLGFTGFLLYLAALSRLELSYIYPFMGLSFVLVALYSSIVFQEHVNIVRWTGIAMIVLGIILVSRTGG
ncbi:MAG: EamA family transporter [Candidatus Eremiobacteraeota bacterium]|nr:EamA family transporter [Candidatus Eremiobacteraeota bacterium]